MSTTPEQERERQVVVGNIVGVIQKGQDTWQVEVQPDGSQYTKRLWSKDQGVVNQMQQMIGQRLAFDCGVSHWNMQDGTPVRSLWLNGYGQAGEVTPQSVAAQAQQLAAQAQQMPPHLAYPNVQQTPAGPVAAPPQTAQPTRVGDTEREKRIHRQTASKVAVDVLKFLDEENRNFASLISISERLVAYYENGVQWPQAQVQPPPPQNPGPEDGHPPRPDDDIPF